MQVSLHRCGGPVAVGGPCTLAHLLSLAPTQAATSLKQFVGAPKRNAATAARRGRLVSRGAPFQRVACTATHGASARLQRFNMPS